MPARNPSFAPWAVLLMLALAWVVWMPLAQATTFAVRQTTPPQPHEGAPFQTGYPPEQMSAAELKTLLKDMEQRGAKAAVAQEVAYYTKYALPMATLFTCLLAAPLALVFSRWGGFVGVALTIVIVFAYYVLMNLCRAMGNADLLSPFLAAWGPNLVFGVAGAGMIWWLGRK